MTEELSKLEKINYLIWVIRRNYPEHHSTFGPCSEDGCENSARGSGLCVYCAEKELGEITGKPRLAEAFRSQTEGARRLVCRMLDSVDSED